LKDSDRESKIAALDLRSSILELRSFFLFFVSFFLLWGGTRLPLLPALRLAALSAPHPLLLLALPLRFVVLLLAAATSLIGHG
jgi:hypothetical protein